jgi:chaperonin cofactor prefoldin
MSGLIDGIKQELEDWVLEMINGNTYDVITALEDKVEDLEYKVSELEDVVEENYRNSIELAQDCADEVRNDLESELESLEARVDDLEELSEGGYTKLK